VSKTIDYFFGVGSPWAFLGLEPFVALAKEHNAVIRPFVIPLIEDNGAIYSRNRPEARRVYWLKDLRRWATLRGKTLSFENRAALSDPTPAGFMVIAAIEAGEDWLRLASVLQEAFWVRGEDIGDAEVRRALADGAGFHGTALERKAQTDTTQAIWNGNIEIARQAGVFGIPTYRHEDELYWGQDSLPFLARHLGGEKIAS
jgi:2-hydroxychromene-2-carboxylate isomerase